MRSQDNQRWMGMGILHDHYDEEDDADYHFTEKEYILMPTKEEDYESMSSEVKTYTMEEFEREQSKCTR